MLFDEDFMLDDFGGWYFRDGSILYQKPELLSFVT
jgi:hypothetical protein